MVSNLALACPYVIVILLRVTDTKRDSRGVSNTPDTIILSRVDDWDMG